MKVDSVVGLSANLIPNFPYAQRDAHYEKAIDMGDSNPRNHTEIVAEHGIHHVDFAIVLL
jgi:hypothetical protein